MKYQARHPPTDHQLLQSERQNSRGDKNNSRQDDLAELNLLNQHKKKVFSPARSNRSVHFDKVQILFYPRILGDNPCCSGAPLSLDWKPFHYEVAPVDQFERFRQCQPPAVSKLSRKVRQGIVLRSGTTQEELNELDASLEPSRKLLRANVSRFGSTGYDHHNYSNNLKPDMPKFKNKIPSSNNEVYLDATNASNSWYGEQHQKTTRRGRDNGFHHC
mmetsp:Transcript_10562/g.16187  ORF Transcript_10562/g.16187 Transcript_10562/m.16187 type:complete len:217 (+) Transcript_10562:205-855(+)